MAHSSTKLAVTVEKLVYGGDGLARFNGQVVLVPFVLPGEQATVETLEQKPGLVRSRLVELHQTAGERVDARCPYFGRCGGCHYQHAGYEAQLAFKRAILAETLRRVGKIEPPEEIRMIAAEPWHYRNRAQFHIQGNEIGYLEARSNRFCGIEHCPISSPRINQVITTLREMLRDARWPRFVSAVEVFTNEQQVRLNMLESERPVARRFFDWCAEAIPGFVPGALDYTVAGETYRVSGGSFFQVNRFLIDQMAEQALDHAAGESALDLFAGVGLFSLPLAKRFAKVTAVESGAGALRDLRFNAERAGVAVEQHQSTVDAFLANLAAPPDFVLADPPRAGLGKIVVRELLRLKPVSITIVACDPATLARDLAALLVGGYKLENLTMVDLFPQTYHIEAIARLSR
ncbi:MAG TPA: class I SAM-dependent RNA methyltransferase [Bryobacteraceae bacterium]|nr:class I SAM-dependent RNA methyltransferase [Bryobacteraceae bacterium]